jgi:hypothetical protein
MTNPLLTGMAYHDFCSWQNGQYSAFLPMFTVHFAHPGKTGTVDIFIDFSGENWRKLQV